MKKEDIKIICAFTKEELREPFTDAFAKVYFDNRLKNYTYEQVDNALKRCEEVLEKNKNYRAV